jgi:16S rRNA (cytosine967-C5)-methyltransferase
LSPRRAAFAVLNEIFFRRKNMDEALAAVPQLDALEPRDKGLARLLVSVVLKRAREMDAALEKLLHEPLKELKPAQLLTIFRLGIAQIAFLETPPHAAVNTSVALAEAEGIAHHKPLVNAIMRRIAREGWQPLDARDAGRMATPDWLWQEWMQDYGVETALKIAAAHLSEAPVDFTVKADQQVWAEKLEAALLPTGSLRKASSGFIPALPGFAEGEWWIQNAAAALPARLFADIKGKAIVDLCAAPGGKTAQLAAMGAKVIAVDRAAGRMRRLEENMQRLRLEAEAVTEDGASFRPKAPVDGVLLDAPCTATGTIRHQPDVLWLKEPRDQDKLVALQRRLLRNAVEMLKPGGALVYCTCSLQMAEGERQADWLLEQGLPVRLSPIGAGELPGIGEMLTPRGELRCLPFHWQELGGMDGFYIARFEKLP